MDGEAGDMTLAQGLQVYFDENGFAPDGGYDDKWAIARLGPIPMAVPNVEARRRSVPIHDLNHVVTGYATDLRGEAEISAWEIGSGCRSYVAAWILGLTVMLAGAGRWPVATVQAFARGRQSRNLYSCDRRSVLDRPVRALRAELSLDRQTRVRPSDVVMLVLWLPVAVVASAFVTATAVVTSPWWLREGVHRQRRLR